MLPAPGAPPSAAAHARPWQAPQTRGGGPGTPANADEPFSQAALVALAHGLDQIRDVSPWPEAGQLRSLVHQRLLHSPPSERDEPVAAALLLDLVGSILYGFSESVSDVDAQTGLRRAIAQLHIDKEAALQRVPIPKSRYSLLKTEILAALMRNREELVAELHRVKNDYEKLKQREQLHAKEMTNRLQATHEHATTLQRTADHSISTLRAQVDSWTEKTSRAEAQLRDANARLDAAASQIAHLEAEIKECTQRYEALQSHLREVEQKHAVELELLHNESEARFRRQDASIQEERQAIEAVRVRTEQLIHTANAHRQRAEAELERATKSFKAEVQHAVQQAAAAAEEMAREDAQSAAEAVAAQHRKALGDLEAECERKLEQQRGKWEEYSKRMALDAVIATEDRMRTELNTDADQRTEAAVLLERASAAQKLSALREEFNAKCEKWNQDSALQIAAAVEQERQSSEEKLARIEHQLAELKSTNQAAAVASQAEAEKLRLEEALKAQASAWEQYAAQQLEAAEARWREERAKLEQDLEHAKQDAAAAATATAAPGPGEQQRLEQALVQQGNAWKEYVAKTTQELHSELSRLQAQLASSTSQHAEQRVHQLEGENIALHLQVESQTSALEALRVELDWVKQQQQQQQQQHHHHEQQQEQQQQQSMSSPMRAAAADATESSLVIDELSRDNALLREQVQSAEVRLNKALEAQAAAWKDFAEKRANEARQQEAARWSSRENEEALGKQANPRHINVDLVEAVRAAREAAEEEHRKQIDALQKEHAKQLSRLQPSEAQAKRVVAAASLALMDMARASHETSELLGAMSAKSLRSATLRAAARERDVFAKGMLRLGGPATPRKPPLSSLPIEEAKEIEAVLFSDVHF